MSINSGITYFVVEKIRSIAWRRPPEGAHAATACGQSPQSTQRRQCDHRRELRLALYWSAVALLHGLITPVAMPHAARRSPGLLEVPTLAEPFYAARPLSTGLSAHHQPPQRKTRTHCPPAHRRLPFHSQADEQPHRRHFHCSHFSTSIAIATTFASAGQPRRRPYPPPSRRPPHTASALVEVEVDLRARGA